MTPPAATIVLPLEGRAYAALEDAANRRFPGRIALVSSFGAEAAVLLHMAARINRRWPVLFVDTGRLFGETLAYRDALARRLRLTDIQTVRAEMAGLRAADPRRALWAEAPDRCCAVRKVAPLRAALADFDAWITGRKRSHGGARADLAEEEIDGRHVKLNPLAAWTAADVDAYFAKYELPRHPLQDDGYASIGCVVCTARTAPGADARSGRWAGSAKTECGIHWPAAGGPPQRLGRR